jgi:hypothetical protein
VCFFETIFINYKKQILMEIKVTNRTMICEGTMWHLSNVTRLKKSVFESKKPLPHSEKDFFIIWAVLGVLGSAFAVVLDMDVNKIIHFVVLVLFGICIFRIMKMKEENELSKLINKQFYFTIETNSGSVDMFECKSEADVDGLIRDLNVVFQDLNKSYDRIVNVENQHIGDNVNSGNTNIGNNIKNVANVGK